MVGHRGGRLDAPVLLTTMIRSGVIALKSESLALSLSKHEQGNAARSRTSPDQVHRSPAKEGVQGNERTRFGPWTTAFPGEQSAERQLTRSLRPNWDRAPNTDGSQVGDEAS